MRRKFFSGSFWIENLGGSRLILLIYLLGGELGRVGRKDSVNVARMLLLLLHAAVVLGHFFLGRGRRGLPGVGRGSTHHHHLRHHAGVLALPHTETHVTRQLVKKCALQFA
jgi:hypothetical protein